MGTRACATRLFMAGAVVSTILPIDLVSNYVLAGSAPVTSKFNVTKTYLDAHTFCSICSGNGNNFQSEEDCQARCDIGH